MANLDPNRFIFIPLKEENAESAWEGELVVDRNSGNMSVKDSSGNLNSMTKKVTFTEYVEMPMAYTFPIEDGKLNLGTIDPDLVKPLAISIDGVTHWGSLTLNEFKHVIYDNRVPLIDRHHVLVIYNKRVENLNI